MPVEAGIVITVTNPGAARAGVPSRSNEGHVDPTDDRAPVVTNELDNDDYPAFSMGRAAAALGVTPAFLRSLDAPGLVVPHRSEGGHRRYSRNQLRIVARVRELVDSGTAVDAACRIVGLEDQLAEARSRIPTK